MKVKTPLRRVEAGLPDDSSVVDLLHNRAAGQTLVHVKLSMPLPTYRLYWRPVGGVTYKPVGAPAAEQSFEYPVTCERPLVFVCGLEWTTSGTGRSLGVFRVNLGDPPTVAHVDLGDILPPGAWVHRLLRADDAGTALDAVVALREGGPIRYTVYRFDLTKRAASELDSLPGVGF